MGKILVVHKNELILDVIQEMLQDVGYAVPLTSDPQRALSKAIATRYNLIIVDRHLEGHYGGGRLVELLRKYGVSTPIIGTAPEGDWTEESSDLVDYLLPAPFEYGQLLRAVSDLLDPKTKATIEELTRNPSEIEELLEGPLELLDDLPPTEDLDLPSPPELDPEPQRPQRPVVARVERPERAWQPPVVQPRKGPGRVLIGDGSDDTRNAVADTIRKTGLEAVACADGHAVVEATMLQDFDLIVLDLWMTGLDGFEVIETLRMSGVDTPVIISTAYITKEMVQELAPHHVHKILLKPFRAKDLLDAIREVAPA